MAGAGNWRSAQGNLLDAVPRDVDRCDLAPCTRRDADGVLFKDLLPDGALRHMNDEYLDYWWVNTGAPQADAWLRHRWRVLRADARTLTITFARLVER